jgi:hypothetical protein
MFDPKLAISVITGAVAAAAAFRRDLDALFGSRRSLVSQIKEEEERLGQIDRSLRELNHDEESCTAARQALEHDRTIAFGRLRRLTCEFSRQREDPNYDLSFLQRLFLLFRPDKERAEVIHWLTGAFLALGIVSILSWIYLANLDLRYADEIEEFAADLGVLGCFGTLLFRAWALAERKWSHNYEARSGVLNFLLIVKENVTARVRCGQVCFWICLYWVLESAEDFAQDEVVYLTGGQPPGVSQTLLKFLLPLAAAAVCRQWAVAELKYARATQTSRVKLARFFRQDWHSVAACLIGAAGACTFTILNPDFFDELLHEIAFILQALILCFSWSQWLALSSRDAVPMAPRPVPAKTQSTAA